MSFRTTAFFAVAVAVYLAAPAALAISEAEKEAMISPEAANAPGEDGIIPGDPTRFQSPCAPLPAITTPHDGDGSNDGGWQLVDFCSAGATGSGPAQPPDCHHNDDDSALLSLGFTFDLYGDSFTSVYVNNNGNMSFGSLFSTFTASGFPIDNFPMVAPFWSDVDTGDQFDPDVHGHIWYKFLDSGTLAVTWDRVGYYNERTDKVNTYQVLISDGSNTSLGQGNNVCFCYDDMQWTTGDASGGVGGFGGVPATVGANRGDGVDFFQVGRFDHSGSDYDGPGGSNDGVDYLDGRGAGTASPICFNVSSENIPPIAQNFPPNDRITAACNEPLDLTVEFLSPEGDQSTTVTVDDPDGAQDAGLVITNTPGNTATVRFEWTPDPDDQDTWAVTMTARDDFIPAGETVRTLTIDVECAPATPLPAVSEEISGLASDSRTGTSVAAAGDLNRDGLMDFIAGAPGYQDNAPVGAGAAAVYLGSTDPDERKSADILFVGGTEHDRAGVSVAGNFDFNQDGTPDILIGGEQVNRTPDDDPGCASGQPCGPGRVWLVYFDPDDATLYPNIGNDGTMDIVDLADVGTLVPGAVFDGDASGDQAGFSVAAGGPIEALPAGGPDIAIGAPGRDVPDPTGDRIDAGTAYVIFSQPLSGSYDLDQVAGTVAGAVYQGAAAGDRLGFAVSFPGDVVDPLGEDFAMGAPEADPVPLGLDQDELSRAGLGLIASGGDVSSGIIEVEDIGKSGEGDGTVSFVVDGIRIQGTQAEMQLGYSIAGGGDNLRNGNRDLMIGAPFYDVPVPGGTDQDSLRDAGLGAQTAGTLERGIIEVEDIGTSSGDGPGGVEGVIYTGAAIDDAFGSAVGGLLDVTGNGSEDVGFGAPLSDADGTENAGRVYLVEGTPAPGPEDGGVEFFLGVRPADGIGAIYSGRQLKGTSPNEEAGSSIAATGDVSGDGSNDFVVGSPGKQVNTGGISLVSQGTKVPSTLPNVPPTADASASQTSAECTGGLQASVALNGSLSSDPDSTPGTNDDIVSFEWFDADGTLISVLEAETVPLPLGTQTVTLRVTDSAGQSSTATVSITVFDDDPPSVTITGPDPDSCSDGTVVEVVDSSSDTCDPALDRTYTCADPCPDPTGGPFYGEEGSYDVTLTVEDEALLTASDTVSFTIDRTDPVVTISNPPPAAHIVDDLPLSVVFTATDDDDADGSVVHEVIELEGCVIYDGDTFGNMDGLLGDEDVSLNENELCRIADECSLTSLVNPTLTVKAFDCAGNMGSDEVSFTGSIALTPGLCTSIDMQMSSPENTTANWGDQTGAVHYDVIRGDLDGLAVEGGEVNLGTVVCVESSSPDATTVGNEDSDLPDPGKVFFFLVQSYDGQVESAWGEDSEGRDRVIRPGNGGCSQP